MKFQASVASLSDKLSIVTRALSARTTNQYLEGILIEAKENSLELTCTDERLTIVTRMNATVIKPGRGIIPGKLFNELIRRIPSGGEVTIEMNDRFRFKVEHYSSNSNIAGYDADMFPVTIVEDSDSEIAIAQATLRQMIEKTDFAVALEHTREVLTGCYLDIRAGEATMVALDGFRLAMLKSQLSEITGELSAIIPARAIGDIGKLLKTDKEAFCTLSLERNRLHVHLEEVDIYALIIEGEYIDYKRIIPTQFATRVTLDAEPLRRSLDRAALFAREGANNLIKLAIEGGTLAIDSTAETGEAHEEIEIDKQGDDLTIAFNAKYLLDIIRAIDTERIELAFNNAISPCVITPLDNADYLHLALPIRMQA